MLSCYHRIVAIEYKYKIIFILLAISMFFSNLPFYVYGHKFANYSVSLHVQLFSWMVIGVLTNIDLTNEFLFSAIHQRWTSGQTYPCDTCGRQYRRIISLQRHKRLECGKEAQFQCSMCNAKFKHKHSLLRHYNVHTVMKSEFQDSFTWQTRWLRRVRKRSRNGRDLRINEQCKFQTYA